MGASRLSGGEFNTVNGVSCTVAASGMTERCVKPIPIFDGGLHWPDIQELPAGRAGVKISNFF